MTEFSYNKELRDYWEEEGITPPQEVIVCAANRLDGIMICSARHWDLVMRAAVKSLGEGRWWTTEEQGFINQFGEFRTREEAMKIVLENGQPFNEERNGGQTRRLYSEGLY